jgi:hypothetical protein
MPQLLLTIVHSDMKIIPIALIHHSLMTFGGIHFEHRLIPRMIFSITLPPYHCCLFDKILNSIIIDKRIIDQ